MTSLDKLGETEKTSVKSDEKILKTNGLQNINMTKALAKNAAVEGVESKNSTVATEEDVENSKPKDNVPKKVDEKNGELSEGEASSGFETVSSALSKNELDDFDLSSEPEEFNVVVQIKNDLAISKRKEHAGPRDYSSLRDKNVNSFRSSSKSRSDYYSKSTDSRYERHRRSEKSKEYWEKESLRRSTEDRKKRHSRDKRSSERDDSRCRRSLDRDLHRSNRHKRSRRSRDPEKRRSRSPFHKNSSRREIKDGGNFNKVDSLKSNPKRKSYPGNENKFPIDVHKKRDVLEVNLSSDDSRKNNGSPKKKRKRRSRSFSISPPTTVWNRLGRLSSKYPKVYKGEFKSDRWCQKNFESSRGRRKERTPFLEELEKKLKESEVVKNINKTADVPMPQLNISNTVATTELPPLPTAPPPVKPPPPSSIPFPVIPSDGAYPADYNFHFSGFPALSVDNLPLVPGPTGLPVHVTVSGEQIPHDVDGRRIPVGPNGYYLPLDPNGRLFPHIISPGNTAVPIHMSEDGVLRLPNSEPVPYGPPHQYPINIDGSIIVIGPDSKPLYPCPNLPKHPPIHLVPEVPAGVAQYQVQITSQELSTSNKVVEPDAPLPVNGKTGMFDTRQKKHQSREVLRVVEIDENLEKRLSGSPAKEAQVKRLGEDGWSSGSDMILDSGDSESFATSDVKTGTGSGTLSSIRGGLSSDDEALHLISDTSNDEKSETSLIQSQSDDEIAKKIKLAIKSLSQSNYKPPVLGRFIISTDFFDSQEIILPDESPLLKNRINLAYLTPSDTDSAPEETLVDTKSIIFRFLPQNTGTNSEEKFTGCRKNKKDSGRPSVTVVDIAVQCDFTSEVVEVLNKEVTQLKNEMVALKKLNGELLDFCKKVRVGANKKDVKITAALDKLVLRNNQILV